MFQFKNTWGKNHDKMTEHTCFCITCEQENKTVCFKGIYVLTYMLNILWEPPLIFAYHNAKAHNEVIKRIFIQGMKLS